MKLSGADILIRCLKEQGVDTCVRVSRRVRSGHLRRHLPRRDAQTHPHRARTGRRTRGGRLRARHGKDGRLPRHIRAGRDQPRDGHRDGVHGFRAPRGHHGQRDRSNLGRDSFQEVDIAGITMPVTKHNYIVKDIGKLAATVREAFYIANCGRKGPVLIDIPKNIQTEQCEYDRAAAAPRSASAVAADSRARRPTRLRAPSAPSSWRAAAASGQTPRKTCSRSPKKCRHPSAPR